MKRLQKNRITEEQEWPEPQSLTAFPGFYPVNLAHRLTAFQVFIL